MNYFLYTAQQFNLFDTDVVLYKNTQLFIPYI